MLIKRSKKWLLYGVLATWVMSSAILGGGVAAGAQTEVLNKQLKEAKDTITDQMVVIEELRENFFKVTGELSAEIERLKEINARQTKTWADFPGLSGRIRWS